MHTTSSAPRRARQVLGGLGVVAASMLLLAPVAGAEAPSTANAGGRSDTAPHGATPEAQAQTAQAQTGQSGQPEAQASRSEQGAEASAARSNSRNQAGGDNGTPPAPEQPEARQAPAPNNGAADPTSPGNSGEHKVTICHRTNSATNPYVQITVDFHAVDGHGEDSDHAGVHTGGVYEPGMKERGEAWGDIIPAFTTPDGEAHPAVNWTAAGQAIFENGCELPAEVPPAGEEGEIENSEDDVLGDAEENDLGTTTPLPESSDGSGPADEVLSEELTEVGTAVGEAVAVLGDQVVRDVAAGPNQVVAASAARPATIASLASTGTGIAALTMFGMGLVVTGYLLVTGLRHRLGASA